MPIGIPALHSTKPTGAGTRQIQSKGLQHNFTEALDISCWHPGHHTFAAHSKTSVSMSVTTTVFPPDSQQAPVCSPKEQPPSESLQGLGKNLQPNEAPALPLPHDYLPVAAAAAGPGLWHRAHRRGHTPRLSLPPSLQAIAMKTHSHLLFYTVCWECLSICSLPMYTCHAFSTGILLKNKAILFRPVPFTKIVPVLFSYAPLCHSFRKRGHQRWKTSGSTW